MAVKKLKKTNQARPMSARSKQSRLEIFHSLSECTGLPKTHVSSVFSALANLVHAHMCKKGSGEFTIPMVGLKIRRVKKKATKARKMHSPLTGQEVEIAGKPARLGIKVMALKPLKLSVLA